MTIQRVATFPPLPDFEQVVRLDGRDFSIRMTWYDIAKRWLCSVATYPDGVMVVQGVTLSNGQRILRHINGTDRPAGELICIDSDPRLPIERDSIADRLALLYVDRATVDSLSDGFDPVPLGVAVSVVQV